MISKFRIQNFRSIVDLTLDFGYGEGKAPNGYKDLDTLPFLTASNKERLVPCMAFFGANASGKSNIINAFQTFKNLIGEVVLKQTSDNGITPDNHFFEQEPLQEHYDPNITNPQNTGSTFEIEFISEDKKFCYGISYTHNAIHKETLSVNGEIIFSVEDLKENFASIQSEAYPVCKLAEIMRVEASDGKGHQIRSMLTCFGTRYAGLHLEITQAFHFLTSRILIVSNTRNFPLEVAVYSLSASMKDNTQKALDEIVEIIRRLDVDIQAIKMYKWGTKVKFYSIRKTVSGELIMCDFEKMESAGTIRMASLVGWLLCAIKTGSVILVDELDNSLHPFIVRELLKLFKKKRYNTKNGQLFFTTHETDILEDGIMRVSEITFVRKNLKYGTMAKRLVDLKRENGETERDIRNVTNFRRQYLQDYYSGVPHPAL